MLDNICSSGVETLPSENQDLLCFYKVSIITAPQLTSDRVAEWLRRSTRNRLGLSRVGSSPASVEFFLPNFLPRYLYSFRGNSEQHKEKGNYLLNLSHKKCTLIRETALLSSFLDFLISFLHDALA